MPLDQETQEAINQAITAGLKSGLGEFKKHFTAELSPIHERLLQFEAVITDPATPDPTQPTESANPETSALMERIAKMEQAEQSRLAELRQMKLSNALGQAVGKHSPLHQDLVTELLSNRYGAKAIEKDGEWYLPNGSKLGEEIDSFFNSEAGLHFVKNPANASLGAESSSPTRAPEKSVKDVTSDDMFADWVL